MSKAVKTFVSKYLKYIVLLVAAAFLVYGLLRGEAQEVLAKAIAVCLECIGIG